MCRDSTHAEEWEEFEAAHKAAHPPAAKAKSTSKKAAATAASVLDSDSEDEGTSMRGGAGAGAGALPVATPVGKSKKEEKPKKEKKEKKSKAAAALETDSEVEEVKPKSETKKEKAKKAKTVKPKTAFELARDQNSPELARAIWKGILHHKRVCEVAMMICQRRGYTNATVMYLYDMKTHVTGTVKYDVFNEEYEKLMTTIQSLREQQCLDVNPLLDVWGRVWNFWSHNFRESLFEFSETMGEVLPSYNQFIGDEASYGYATDEMEGVDF
jgi:hypothetical protein